MNILMLTQDFPPEIGSASHLFYELARSLVQSNNRVNVITTFPRYYSYRVVEQKSFAKSRWKLFLRECINGINVIRMKTLPMPKGSIFARGVEQFLLPSILLFGGLFSGRHDVVLIYSPPLPLGLAAYLLSKVKRIPFIVNIQDLYPQAVVDQGLIKNRLLIRVFETIERFVYKKANFLTVHSEGNRDYLIAKGADPSRVVAIPNWADTDEIKPSTKHNQFRQENNLGKKFVVSYAGIMSPFQGLESIIYCAALLRRESDILFLMVGDGLEKEHLELEVAKLKLSNVKFLPMQPKSKYPQVLHASDVCLVSLNKKTKSPVVPAKLLGIMASGRPVIASVPLEGDTPKIVNDANCGLVVEPENPQMLADAILKLYNNSSLTEALGKNGREYVEKHFSLRVCSKMYEELFEKLSS
jgi:colanic acid biosynthesis glycosyl transferase WcaI